MEVYALVGASGTGKSHRVAFVASEYNIDLIIDDGLLIKESNILGGVSAKSQGTRMGAIRTALFSDGDHARNAIDLINLIKPKRVLILGTSPEMAGRIAGRLRLPGPEKVITIEDIATEEEIRAALHMRNSFGKHIIPVPSAEVKKSLSGILADPVHVFLRLKNRPKPKKTVEKTIIRPSYFQYGKTSIADNVINDLARRILLDSGLPLKPGKALIEHNGEGVRINLTVQVRYGMNIPAICKEAQKVLHYQMEYFTGLNILSVDIIVHKIVVDER